jgi:hypothetical protein
VPAEKARHTRMRLVFSAGISALVIVCVVVIAWSDAAVQFAQRLLGQA